MGTISIYDCRIGRHTTTITDRELRLGIFNNKRGFSGDLKKEGRSLCNLWLMGSASYTNTGSRSSWCQQPRKAKNALSRKKLWRMDCRGKESAKAHHNNIIYSLILDSHKRQNLYLRLFRLHFCVFNRWYGSAYIAALHVCVLVSVFVFGVFIFRTEHEMLGWLSGNHELLSSCRFIMNSIRICFVV